MTKYERAAVRATQLLKNKKVMQPLDAWQRSTISIFGKGTSQQVKGCPREAFLGLCEADLVVGVAPGAYTHSKKNKKYAINAIAILKSKPRLASDKMALWKAVLCGKKKTHNSQMDVVTVLWSNAFIKK